MKKIVSLVLAMVLMVSVFAMLGTVTASAETYYVSKTLVNLTFDGDDAPYGIPAHRGNFKNYVTDADGNGVAYVLQPDSNGAVFFIGKDGTVGNKPVDAFSNAKDVKLDEFFMFKATKTYRVSLDYKYLKGTGEGAGLGNGANKPYVPTGSDTAYARLFTDPSLSHITAPNNDATFGHEFEKRVTVISQTKPSATWTPDENGQLGADTEWKTAEFIFTVKENDPGFAMAINPGHQGKTYVHIDNIKVEELLDSYEHSDTGVYTMDNNEVVNMSSTTVTYEDDAEKGKVVKVVGTAGGRAYIPGTPVVKANTKYFVTFDAKGIAAGNFINLGVGRFTDPGGCRLFFMGYNDQQLGTKLYIKGKDDKYGKETAITKDFTNVTTEWQSYGLVIDTSHPDFVTRANVAGEMVLSYTSHIFFGAASSTVYFDNVRIVEMSEPDISAVPEKDASAKYSIRKEAEGLSAGLRFKGDVDASVKATADEIGFVVAPAELVAGEENWYKVDSLNKNAKKAVAYNGTKDVVYDVNGDSVSYQLVLTNLGNLASRRFAAVMYVKTGDTYTYISLGEISYNAVATEYAVRGY